MSILKNAVASIQVGVEDYLSGDSRRLISALRNLYAGILLLAKAHLSRCSPADSNEALIKERVKMVPRADGSLSVIGVGKKTVDVRQIQARLADLGVTFNWGPLDKLQEIRNNIEHYYFDGTTEQLRAAMHDAHLLVHGLVGTVLREDPVALLGKECWEVLLKESTIYEAEAQKCQKTLEGVAWPTARAESASEYLCCPNCASNLVRHSGPAVADAADLELSCVACGAKFDFQRSLEAVLNNIYFAEAHFAMLDGEEAPVERCPDCGGDTYVHDDAECACCGFALSDETRCLVCDQPLSLDEFEEFTNLCGYHAYQVAKDD